VQKEFWRLVRLGGELRRFHLLEHPNLTPGPSPAGEESIVWPTYPATGDNVVAKGYPRFTPLHPPQGGTITPAPHGEGRGGAVFINENQYFAGVPESVWNFYIGGYQPAQKWLKDRRERQLGWEDLLHYQRIIVALAATERLMGEIDKV
jgi:hypothetical protein